MDVKLFWRCLFSPTLFSIHRGNPHFGKYDPNDWERWGDNLVTSVFFLWNVGVYSSPVLMYMLVRKGYFTVGGVVSLAKLSIGLGVIVTASYCIRSYGRSCNSKYRMFLNTLDKANKELNNETKRELKKYDFEFSAWPVEFKYEEVAGERKKGGEARRAWGLVQSPCSLVSYLVLHTFGIRLIYPGSIRALSYMMGSALNLGRAKLIESNDGERFKLKTSDGNFIDAMYVDQRKNRTNGTTLVVCSEGNAGFYEYGIMVTPIEAGYSVLGWNHPGFAGSTGMPYPEEEENAIDTVMQFAIHRLGFVPEKIVLFGWSIGGFTASWAAMTYPAVKALILDATFDDLLPLAIPRMPATLEPMVRITIRGHANLDIARQVVHYPGPILLVRRSDDEVITIEPNELSTNRGNHLLVKLLKARYPPLIDDSSEAALLQWLAVTGSRQGEVSSKYKRLSEAACVNLLSSIESVPPAHRPQLLLFLASKYLVDYRSTHCTPLPSSMFRIPEQL